MIEERITLDEVIQNVYDAGVEYAEAYAIYQRYKEGFKHTLSTIKQQIRSMDPPNGKKSWTKDDLEEFAYAEDDYKLYLDNWEEAVRQMNLARNVHDCWKSKFEALRTEMATERAFRT